MLLLAAGASLLTVNVSLSDIRKTKHNLMSTQEDLGGKAGRANRDAVCVFCHTPAGRERGGSEPSGLTWQRARSATDPFVMYDDVGRAGQMGSTAIGSQSVACMACHDYSQAFGINVSIDHPFSIPYRGFHGAPKPRDEGTEETQEERDNIRRARRMVELAGFRVPVQGVVENQTVWWVPADPKAVRRGKSDLPLFTRGPDPVVDIPHIECASCHDPHTENKVFLRVSNTQSRLCLTCHDT